MSKEGPNLTWAHVHPFSRFRTDPIYPGLERIQFTKESGFRTDPILERIQVWTGAI